MKIYGLHHVTAIAGDPQSNIDFYTGVLGLRLVKVTVNFDDPGSYHLYYGNELGQPGSILTFFAWPGAFAGRAGTSQITATAFCVPANSLEYWTYRLANAGLDVQGPFERFGEKVLRFTDPDEMGLELIEPRGGSALPPWKGSPIPAKYAIGGLHSVTVSQQHAETTAGQLNDVLDFRQAAHEANRFRYETGDGRAGAIVDVLHLPRTLPGTMGVGAIHHVAWRVPNDSEQAAWRERLLQAHTPVTPVRNRVYFHSIYFHEPGGVLFEIATDEPGFAVDEPAEHLGSHLQLPAWLEPLRGQMEHILPPLHLPMAHAGAADRQGSGHGAGHEYE